MMNLPPDSGLRSWATASSSFAVCSAKTLANAVIPQLLVASRTARPAHGADVYIDSPGGTLGAALSVYDVMQSLALVVGPCIGVAGGATVLVLAGGTLGQRYALPRARMHLMDEATASEPRHASDLASQAQAARDLSEGSHDPPEARQPSRRTSGERAQRTTLADRQGSPVRRHYRRAGGAALADCLTEYAQVRPACVMRDSVSLTALSRDTPRMRSRRRRG
jgi:hypothetical protein